MGFSFFFSCKNSNHVVSGNFLAKRKYTKGWHTNFISKKTCTSLSEKTSLETSVLSEAAAETEIKQNEMEVVASVQMPLYNNSLEKKKTHTTILHSETPTIQKNTKSNHTVIKEDKEQPEPEKKKTNPWALCSFLSFLIIVFGAMALYAFSPVHLQIILHYSPYIFMPSAFWGVISQKKKKATPNRYKNNGLAIPGIILGFLLALLPAYLFLMLFPYDFTFLVIIYLAYLLTPFLAFLYLFYDTFLKKEKTSKPEPTKEEKEELKRKLEKQNRFALILLFSGLLLALVLLFFPMFFLQALPKNMDFYLFLFACLLFLMGIFKYISTLIGKRKYKK